MFKDYDHKDVEFAIQVLYHPEQIGEDEMREWFADKEHRELFEELRRYKEVGLQETGSASPDVKRQWHILNERARVKRRVQLYRWFTGVAAAIVVIVSVTLAMHQTEPKQELPELKTVLTQLSTQKTVRLVTSGGQEIALGKRETRVEHIPGVERIQVDSLEGIKYHDVRKEKIEYHTLEIPRGAEYMVILDDGTEVWLNAESVLRYPTKFVGQERIVELLGEGYFEVKSDPERPFIVRTSGVDTRVLGTEFNVQAYEGQPVNITLVEGSVAVKEASGEEVILKPGENACLADGVLNVEKVDVQLFTSWKDGFFYFEDVRLEDLLAELGRWYDFTVFFQNPESKDFRFKFWADRKENFENVINRLSETATVSLIINDKNVIVCSQ